MANIIYLNKNKPQTNSKTKHNFVSCRFIAFKQPIILQRLIFISQAIMSFVSKISYYYLGIESKVRLYISSETCSIAVSYETKEENKAEEPTNLSCGTFHKIFKLYHLTQLENKLSCL